MEKTLIEEQLPVRAAGQLRVDVRVLENRQRVVLTVCGSASHLDFTRAALRIGERALSLFEGPEPGKGARYAVEVDAAFAQLHVATVGWAGTFREEATTMVEVLELASATVLGSGDYRTLGAREWVAGKQASKVA